MRRSFDTLRMFPGRCRPRNLAGPRSTGLRQHVLIGQRWTVALCSVRIPRMALCKRRPFQPDCLSLNPSHLSSPTLRLTCVSCLRHPQSLANCSSFASALRKSAMDFPERLVSVLMIHITSDSHGESTVVYTHQTAVVRVRRAYLRVFAPPSGTGKGDPGGA
ncbi:hypothetical protein BD310DRAFT_546009 [Dichomitus squalens]|uniref:Uncharacterized protein n=1 Tax=Dichomitus squalens TaxID=114155 RepID=A0A4Q9PSS2_9APHY|nr:hypothetical protein BD310DRAFT_546009 [Dichomitus squalens]